MVCDYDFSHACYLFLISGYLSKKPQNVLKNFKNLLIPYVLGYTLTWYSQIWLGRSVDYEILRPTGSVMWYILALFIYRLTIEALGKIRFIVLLSILFALWGRNQTGIYHIPVIIKNRGIFPVLCCGVSLEE